MRDQGTIFLGGPPLVKAATGEVVTAEELGGADVHTRISGVTDHLRARTTRTRSGIARRIVADLNTREARRRWRCAQPAPPRYDRARDSTAWCPPIGRKPFDVREIIARLVDGSEFDEFKRLYGADAGHRLRAYLGLSGRHHRQQRHPVQRERAEGRAFHRAVRQRNIPLVFLQNITGFMVGRKYEAGGIAKDGAKMVTAVATAGVPKFTVIIGGSLRRRQLRHVRPRLFAALPVDVAERAHLA